MIFAVRPEANCRWWATNLAGLGDIHVEDGGFCWFEADGIEVGFHPADDGRNPIGGSPVIYWATRHVEAKRQELIAAGCRQHRGPLALGPSRKICQLVDPFGNTFGLDGG